MVRLWAMVPYRSEVNCKLLSKETSFGVPNQATYVALMLEPLLLLLLSATQPSALDGFVHRAKEVRETQKKRKWGGN